MLLVLIEKGFGGIVNSSRGLIAAYQKEEWKQKYQEEEFGKATRAEAIKMREEINQNIKKG